MKKKIKGAKKKTIDVKKKTIPLILIAAVVILVIIFVLNSPIAPKEISETKEEQPVEETPKEESLIDVSINIEGEAEEIALEETETEEITPKEENIIEIMADSFYPDKKTVNKNTEIKWVNSGNKEFRVACYLGGTRVTTSSNLKENDFFTYTFIEGGEYTCITYPYGLRNTIIVESEQPLLSPTGSAVIGGSGSLKGASLSAIALIAIIILLFFIYGRKRRQRENLNKNPYSI